MDENVRFFVSESREMLEEVEPRLIELEQYATQQGNIDEETVNLIFRLFHSLKGSAGFLQFPNVVEVTHHAETLLDLFRSGKASLESGHTNVLFRTCDLVNALLDRIETTGSDGGLEQEVKNVTAELSEAISREKGGKAPVKSEQAPPAEATEDSTSEPVLDEFDFQVTPEMVQRFTQEADEQLELVEQSMLEIEKTPDRIDPVQDAFRALHSFKGNCGFMGFGPLEKLSHSLESILGALKDGELEPDSSHMPTILHVVDVLRSTVADISTGGEGDVDNVELLLDLLGDLAPKESKQEPPLRPVRADIQQPEALWLLREDVPEAPPIVDEKPATTAPADAPAAAPEPMLKARSVFRQDIRVDLAKLDQLINLVGELVIAEDMVVRNPDVVGREFENFEGAAAHLDKIVRDLQDMALSVRMIPIAGVFRKMIRLVRDLAARSGKKVNLRLLGEDTEIDKTVAELIADPLVHLVRNGIDHAIEPPDERLAAGKEETGELVLEARHEGGEVWITIRDDGRGLDREKILSRAVERGLVEGDGSALSDQDVYNLIFEPGFSTAEKVTDVSGRGVGMDVVKKNVERMKGHIDVRTQPGRGTVLVLRIPLTLAIMDGLLIRVGTARYTIPILSIRESIQIDSSKVTRTMDGQEVVKVREELFPVVRLHELHGVKADYEQLHEGILVILEHQGDAFALFVDELLGEQQTVIKGLSNYMGDVRGVSGCTILGDGEISLILDVGGLLKLVASGEESKKGKP
jgi:two-component system chemotaxis sensor kinase CheA